MCYWREYIAFILVSCLLISHLVLYYTASPPITPHRCSTATASTSAGSISTSSARFAQRFTPTTVLIKLRATARFRRSGKTGISCPWLRIPSFSAFVHSYTSITSSLECISTHTTWQDLCILILSCRSCCAVLYAFSLLYCHVPLSYTIFLYHWMWFATRETA